MTAPNAAPSLRTVVRGVVERARAGDQVAMGILAEVRDRAAKGDASAVISRGIIKDYLKKNPQSLIGAEPLVMNTRARSALSAIWRAPVDKFVETFVKASPHLSMWQAVMAVVHRGPIVKNGPLVTSTKVKGSRMGAIVCKAMKLKRLWNPNTPLSTYCQSTGWEHGE